MKTKLPTRTKHSQPGDPAVACSAWLSVLDKLDKGIYRLKNYSARVVLLAQLLCLQSAKCGNQPVEGICVFNRVPDPRGLSVKLVHPAQILRDAVVRERLLRESWGGNLGTPLMEKCQESSPPTDIIAVEQKPVAVITASQRTSENRQYLNDLYEAMYPLMAICGYIAGWWLCGYLNDVRRHKRNRRGVTPNPAQPEPRGWR